MLTAGYLAGYENPATRSAYAGDLRQWFAWCATANLDALSARRPHVQLYASQLHEQGLAPGTVARRLSVLGGLYRYAVDEGFLGESPVARVRRPKVPQESPTLGLDRAELTAMLAAAVRTGRVEHALLSLLALNGLRVSEACGADVTSLGHERGHRVLRITRKGGKHQLVPLAPPTASAVDAAAGERLDGPLLLNRRGRRLTRQQAWTIVRQLAAAAGITKRVHPHSCRHAFCTLALDAGVDIRTVQVAAGHANPSTTARYDRARRDLDGAAAYAVADWLQAS